MPQCTSVWFTPIIAGAFTLAGVWLGNFLNQRNSYKQAHRQKMRELRVRSYAKLMGLKIPMTQVVRTHGEAKILCEYYDARFHITHDVSDLEESKKQNERSLAFIQEISKLRREISEVLGEVKIAFPASDELNQAVHAVYSSSAIDVPEVRGTVATVEALDAWKTRIVKSLASMVQAEYANKIESLLVMLYPSTDKA